MDQSWDEVVEKAVKIQAVVRRFNARRILRLAKEMYENSALEIESEMRKAHPSYSSHTLFSENFVLNARLYFFSFYP